MPTDPIRHVVLLMLENHSFDQMLGALAAVRPGLDGVDPNAAPQRTNVDRQGRAWPPRPTRVCQIHPDPKHDFESVRRQLEDDNGAFVLDYVEKNGERATEASRGQIMEYFELDSLPALHALGREFVVCDRWFASLPGPTWPNRMFALSGTSMGLVHMPEGGKHFG